MDPDDVLGVAPPDFGAPDWLGSLAIDIAAIGVDLEVIEPPELIAELRVLADRFQRASGNPADMP